MEKSYVSELIADELQARQMRFSDLIRGLKFDYQIRLYDVLYNNDTVVGIEHILERKLGIDAGFWVRLERLENKN